jgi:hypothetical protein
MSPDQVVVGVGEVGSALLDLLNGGGRQAAAGHDPAKALVAAPGPYAVMHVCLRWSEAFLPTVRAYQATFAPGLTIVHSTVPVGTTAQIPGAVHSPVEGSHGRMRDDLARFAKWVGGPRAEEAAAILRSHGIACRVVASSELTEALKLLSLAHYGVDIAMSHLAQAVLTKLVDDDTARAAWTQWIENYNAGVETDKRSRTLWPDGPRIGGHCVVPGTALLAGDFPHELLDGVLRYR